jgi:hypothetical protein
MGRCMFGNPIFEAWKSEIKLLAGSRVYKRQFGGFPSFFSHAITSEMTAHSVDLSVPQFGGLFGRQI